MVLRGVPARSAAARGRAAPRPGHQRRSAADRPPLPVGQAARPQRWTLTGRGWTASTPDARFSGMATGDLLDEALKLPTEERGRIVHELIRSLDEDETEPPDEVERAWAIELERRATRALRGESVSRNLNTVCDELEAKRHTRT